MIAGIDHLVLLCDSLQSGVDAFTRLSGREPDWLSESPDGSASALFQLESGALELMAPHGDGQVAKRLRELLAERGPGLQTLVLASDDLEADHRRLTVAGLEPGPVADGSIIHPETGATRRWRRFRLGDGSGAVRIFVLQREPGDPLVCTTASPGSIIAVDHLVISSKDAGRALTNYGEKLGLPLTLDRAMGTDGMRLLVFGCGDSGIEVACRASESKESSQDRLWGVTWRTADIEAAHRRMKAAGFNITDVKQGIRRGTRVFTVRDGTLGVPTLMLSKVEP